MDPEQQRDLKARLMELTAKPGRGYNDAKNLQAPEPKPENHDAPATELQQEADSAVQRWRDREIRYQQIEAENEELKEANEDLSQRLNFTERYHNLGGREKKYQQIETENEKLKEKIGELNEACDAMQERLDLNIRYLRPEPIRHVEDPEPPQSAPVPNAFPLQQATTILLHQQAITVQPSPPPSRIVVCIGCYRRGLSCDTGSPCRECSKAGRVCKRAMCDSFKRVICRGGNCSQAHEVDGYDNVTYAGPVSKRKAPKKKAKKALA
ncbi:hypothetical protein BDV96DRAFT_681751 [Lophiotrema nucula]|uniref:C3H1-type domain-containing protein n=1 Tax=Lophiotrema nucula TaxID=690887 RepID=A0A6A5ZVX2_9PLEO|nr:hypothetical protein BDV96DRAFT_681751 [Lophiotrema nucula]